MSDKLTGPIKIAAVVSALYILSYFAIACPGITLTMGGRWYSFPNYRGLPDRLFRPLHQWDRMVLRPTRWEGKNPALTAQEMRALETNIMIRRVAVGEADFHIPF
jgi:hypothetical protein